MKTISIGLISVMSFFAGSSAIADVFGEEDDSYLGLQVAVPFDSSLVKLVSGRFEYSALLVNQTEGIRDGFTFIRDINGAHTFGYLQPSQTFRLGQSKVSDYAIPVVSLHEGSDVQNVYNTEDMIVGLVIGIAMVAALVNKVGNEIDDCFDSDSDSEEIDGC